jgi:predicted HicB family RNase H-like nuclease
MRKLNVAIPDEEHRQLKVQAAEQNKTIRVAVLEAIRDWLRVEVAAK